MDQNKTAFWIGIFGAILTLFAYSQTWVSPTQCILAGLFVLGTSLLDRKSLKLGPDDYLHVEGFASNLFSKADKQDRAGRADLNTAKTFYAASIIFEILNQFGELQPDLEQKQKYAAWKAADIRKALEEGRKPIPGPPGGDTDLSVPSSTYNGANDLESSRSDVADLSTRSDLARVDSAARTAPARDSFPQAYDHNNLQHSTEFSQPPSNVLGSPASGIPPQSHHPTDNYSGVDPASRMAPDSDSFPQAYNHDNFQHPASFSRLPSNVMGSPASGIPPQSHHPTDNYSGVDPASRMAPDSDSFPQAYNHDNFQHFASFSRLPSNVMGSRASGIPPQSHHPTDNYSGVDPASRMAPNSDSFPQAYNHDNFQHPASFSRLPPNVMGSPASGIPPQSHHLTDNYSGVDLASRMAPDSNSFPQAYNLDNFQHPASFSQLPSNVAAPPPSTMAPPSHFPSENIHQPPNGSEHSVYHHQSHPHPPYQPEPHQSIPQNYPYHDIPSFASYPNFQSYLSFTESSLPAASSHYPSYYQGSDVATYSSSPPSNAAAPYASTPQYSSSGKNGSLSDVSSPTSERYEYDSSYQPPPEKIAEAHKAARFAVGALAFDEVSVAVDHLKKALDLLTNPSSAH